MGELDDTLEELWPTGLSSALDKERPYDGQPWTDAGVRGSQEVTGLTMRDIRDCFIRGCYEASGLNKEDYPETIYDLPWGDMNIIAVEQNMACWIERYMGIFPNVPKLVDTWEHIPLINEPEK